MDKTNIIKKESVDTAVESLLEKARKDGVETVWERLAAQSPQCSFGEQGICCRSCSMGPCRIRKSAPKGVCGATADTIAARHFVKMIAAGTAAHSDHGRAVAELFLAVAKNEVSDYRIKDEKKLMQLAGDFGIKTEGKKKDEIAREVGEIALAQFGQQKGELAFIKKAPTKRQEIWRKMGIVPRGIDREITETMHRTVMGNDQDYQNLLLQGSRCALSDGWGGSMIATELQDVLFGTPVPVRGQVNLGVLKEDEVNIIVHGHEPLLSEMIVVAAADKEMLQLAKAKEAKGINIAGMCCSANEILMRHGIPVAGNMLQQEAALVTGAVEVVVVDVQCIMQSLPEIAKCYHTKIITTSPKAKIPGAIHVNFDEHTALNSAKEIVRRAIENFSNRTKNVSIPHEKTDLIAGFSYETINYLLGGAFRGSFKPLNDNIINGRIRGVAGVVGCNNPKVTQDESHLIMVKELIKNDVLVLQTGCSAIACAKAGLMLPEAAAEYAGAGLAEVCETVGIPPVLHLGSCV
ncbi:MAG: anaerobic carbon-monoxide dehydrogenase catalytic subunit, partial [Candidatus Omnitrophota bacterium]